MSRKAKTLMVRMKILAYNAVTYAKFPINLVKIHRIVKQPTYYPEMERKSISEMWKDNIKWLLKNKEVNYLYTGYGLDIKNFRNADDFIPHRIFCRERDAGVKNTQTFYGEPFNEIVLIRDKYVFSAFMEATVGPQVIPATIGLLDNGKVFLHASKQWISFTEFCMRDFQYVFKEIDGTYGDGVRMICNEKGRLLIDKKEQTVEKYLASLGKQRVLIQGLIIQHEALRAFKTSCVNTIRAITIRGRSGKIDLFAAFLRVGNDSETFVDNRAKGGLAVGVELDTGRLMKYGFPHEHFGTKTSKHGLSGIVFEGYQLPYWKETVEMIINAHMQFPDIATIGWDVTMTDNGPIIVEANDGWEISGPQDTYGGLKKRWNQLRNQ